ncbi:MAG TPA: hypothetical protein VIO14_04205 [Dehalococcoidia bacterium]
MMEPLTLVVLRSRGRVPDGIGRLVAATLHGKSAVIPAEDVLDRWIASPAGDTLAERTLGANLLKLNAVTLLKNGYHVVVEAGGSAPEQGIRDLVYLAGTFGVRAVQVELAEPGEADGGPEGRIVVGPDPEEAARRVVAYVRRR